MVSDAFAMMTRPVLDDPVKDTTSTSGWLDNTEPTSVPCSLTELMMPRGKLLTASKQPMTAALVNGVCGAGLTTTLQPAASAGATDRTSSVTGAFQGTMTDATPDGSRVIKLILPGPLSKVRPNTFRATPA